MIDTREELIGTLATAPKRRLLEMADVDEWHIRELEGFTLKHEDGRIVNLGNEKLIAHVEPTLATEAAEEWLEGGLWCSTWILPEDYRHVSPQMRAVGQAVAEELMTEADSEETMRLVLEIPAAWAKLAAWRYIRQQYRQKGEHEPTEAQPTWGIKLPPERAHRTKARHHLHHVLDQWFQEAVTDLWNGEAWELTDLRPDQIAKPLTKEERASLKDKLKDLDDEIPF